MIAYDDFLFVPFLLAYSSFILYLPRRLLRKLPPGACCPVVSYLNSFLPVKNEEVPLNLLLLL